MTERAAIGAMGYEGDPLSAHVMFASGDEVDVGLRSPSGRMLQRGDGVTTAIGFWGGLCCRAGLLAEGTADLRAGNADYIERFAAPYWSAIAAWYESLSIGVSGSEIHRRVMAEMEPFGFAPALNPGHLIHADEWMNTPIYDRSPLQIQSGMTLQSDIIPDCTRPGWAANCEDTVAVADAALRADLADRHPDVWYRITARRDFMIARLGIQLRDEVLPLSTLPGYFSPFWLSPEQVFVRA
jgi:hypothetical protein